MPDTPSVKAALSDSSSSSVFFWLQQPQSDGPGAAQDSAGKADTVLLGFSLAPGAEPGADAEGLLPVVPAWRTVLPGRLLAMASRDPTEPVHSYVKVRLPAACTAPKRPEMYSFVAAGS